MTLQLNHVHLKTQDPEKTAKFYVDTLGAKIVSQSSNGSYRLDLHGLALNVTTFIETTRAIFIGSRSRYRGRICSRR